MTGQLVYGGHMTTNQNQNEVYILMIEGTFEIVGAVTGTKEEAVSIADILNRGRFGDMVTVKTTDVIRLS